jgi:hypothetical protein
LIPELATATALACEAPAAEIALGEAVSSEVVGEAGSPWDRKYYCVEIPPGAPSITFELAGTTADLNLIVGFPDLETVQNGGFWFWHTDEGGAVDKTLVVEWGTRGEVAPGPVLHRGVSGRRGCDVAVRADCEH